jgi:hypothetical protein
MRPTFLKHLYSSNFLFRTALAVMVVGIVQAQPVYAQNSSVAPAPSAPHHKLWHHKQKNLDAIPSRSRIDARVAGGVLTVDGLVAKVELNYDIHHAGYLYFFAPGVGTAVVSLAEMPGATKIKEAIHGSTVAFTVDGHSFSLENDATLEASAKINEHPVTRLQKEKARAAHDIYVLLDANSQMLYRSPQVGYGDTKSAPYAFPLSDSQPKDLYAHLVQPPPMPVSLLPRTKATGSGATGGR